MCNLKNLTPVSILWVALLVLGATRVTAQQSQSNAGSEKSQQQQAPATDAAQGSEASGQSQPDNATGAAGPACWKQAGLTPKAMRTRASIMANAKRQVDNVTNDTSLTPQQQKRQIRQIRQNAKAQIEKFVTPEQETTLRECQRQRKVNAAPPAVPNATPPPAPQN